MSSGLEHRECTQSLGAYVLGALPEAESAQVELHLASCRECQAELEWLRVAADALPASVAQVAAPPSLKDRVMNIVEAEAELLRAAGKEADLPESRPRWRAWGRSRPFLSWRPVAAVAVVCAVGVAAVLVATGGSSATRIIPGRFSTQVLSGARASLVVRGTRASLVVHDLPAPAANHVDELWVSHRGGPPQPAGTFVIRSGSVVVQRPVGPGDQVLMTEEPGRGTRAPTTAPVLVVHV